MTDVGVRQSVFTTLRMNDAGLCADVPLHLKRLKEHAERLSISLPLLPDTVLTNIKPDSGLLRLRYHAINQAWEVEQRPRGVFNDSLDALTIVAPRWNKRTTGCKHGDWQPYTKARVEAERSGCDLALLAWDGAIVDADRATPLLLDDDGTIWASNKELGGVESIVLQTMIPYFDHYGYPIQFGRLTEEMVNRCRSMVVVGTGVGVCEILTIDGYELPRDERFIQHLVEIENQHFTDNDTWSLLGNAHDDHH